MNVRVDGAWRRDQPFARDHFGAGADHDVDAGLNVRIAALADADDAPVLDADVGLDDAPVIDDQRIGDDGVDDVGGVALALAHPVADDLAAAELHFLAIDRMVAFDLDDQLGVAQAHAVASGRAVHLGIGSAADGGHSLPITF